MNEFAVMSLSYVHQHDSVYVIATTNNYCHLTCYHTPVKPLRHKDTRALRGLNVPWGAYFCLTAWRTVEQIEPGDTLIHTFLIPYWIICQTKHFALKGMVSGVPSHSVSAIFPHHNPGPRLYQFESYTFGDDNDIECWAPTYWIAQTFTPQVAHTITQPALLLYRTGLPGLLTLSIRPTLLGKPVLPDLCIATTDCNTLPIAPPYEWRFIDLGAGVYLEVGVQYAIVIRCLTSNLANMLSWRADFSNATYPRGRELYSVNSGGFWTAESTHDMMFQEWGER